MASVTGTIQNIALLGSNKGEMKEIKAKLKKWNDLVDIDGFEEL